MPRCCAVRGTYFTFPASPSTAAAIAAIAFARGEAHGTVATTLAVIGALIGSVSFTGSCVAYAKLQGLLKKAHRLPAQNAVNVLLALAAIALGAAMIVSAAAPSMSDPPLAALMRSLTPSTAE